jgi:hypothetical protein
LCKWYRNFAGFHLGIKARFQDHHSAALKDEGINADVTKNGYLFIGNTDYPTITISKFEMEGEKITLFKKKFHNMLSS